MSLSDARRARLLDALDDWRDGEKVYGDEAAKYAGAWWIDAGRPRKPCGFRWKSRPAWETLKRLRGAANEVRATYYETAASLGESPPRMRRPPVA